MKPENLQVFPQLGNIKLDTNWKERKHWWNGFSWSGVLFPYSAIANWNRCIHMGAQTGVSTKKNEPRLGVQPQLGAASTTPGLGAHVQPREAG